MFIELTDHLRCPADHDESFLVLIPDEMRGREVVRGILGCPVCSREYRILDRIAYFGDPAPALAAPGPSSVTAPALAAFLGLEGPGGYVGLIGTAASFAKELSGLLPGIHLVAVNPPTSISAGESWSLLRSPRVPFKKKALRGVVLGSPFGNEAEWVEASVRAVLPGLRAVGQGAPAEFEGFELMAEAEGWWVGRGR